MKHCEECGNELLARVARGSYRTVYTPKKYCSVLCRNHAMTRRRMALGGVFRGNQHTRTKIIDVKGVLLPKAKELGSGQQPQDSEHRADRTLQPDQGRQVPDGTEPPGGH